MVTILLLEKLISDLPVHPVIDPINRVRFSMSEQPIPLKLLYALDISNLPIRIKLPGDQILKMTEIQPRYFVQLVLSSRFLYNNGSLLPLRRACQTGEALKPAASSD